MLFKTNGNNEKVRITSGGNVGIGITNPTVKLVSAGRIKIQGEPTNISNLIFTRSDRSWSINNETDFRIYTSSGTTDSPSSLVLAINGGGNLGIGINSPTRLLHLHESSSSGTLLAFTNTTTGSAASDGALIGIQDNESLIVSNKENNHIEFHTNNTERLRITSSGELVSTNGTLRRNVSDSSFTVSGDTASNTGANINLYGASHSSLANVFRVRTGSTERFRITSNGNIGIGENNPQNSLHISGSAPAIRFADTGANGSAFSIIEDNNGLLKIRNDAGNSGTGSGIAFEVDAGEKLRITSDGTLNLSNGTINLGTADSSSGHINAYELMTFNIDSDNDDTNRHFTWYKNGESGSGTGMMRLDENGRLCVGGDLATSANNITLKNSGTVEIDMHSTSGSGNNFRLKSDSGGIFTIRDHSAGADRLTIRDNGNIGIGDNDPSQKLNVAGNIMLEGGDQFMYLSNVGTGNAGIYVRGNSSSNFLRSHTTGMFTWEVTGSEKLRLTSDGKLMTSAAGYIYTTSSAGSLSLYGGNTNLGGGIVLSGGNSLGDIRFYAQASTSSPAQRMVIGATGQVEVSNSVSGNDAAVNIYKSSGSNSDKAILRVGYDAAAAFEIYRIRNNGDIFAGPNQSGSDFIFQNRPTGGSITERLRITDAGAIIKGSTNSAAAAAPVQLFFNKRGSQIGKRVHQGSGGTSTTHNLLTISSWQSSNTRFFAYVTVHYVNPIANFGGRMETYAAANYGGTRACWNICSCRWRQMG